MGWLRSLFGIKPEPIIELMGVTGEYEDTWTCHVCGELRPDSKISVHAKDISAKYNSPEGTILNNIRHCNDRNTCIKGAKEITWG